MQRSNPETTMLADILITEELSLRVPRVPNWQAETEAMRALGRQMAQAAASLMQTLVDTALELCAAGTIGVSLLETTPEGTEIFRAQALAGVLAHHVGGSTPRNFSPCGVCLDQGIPVLFSHPERYFTYFQAPNTPIVEGLVLPLIADNHALGTIWIMSHSEQRHFDAEDVRVMTSLADFTAAALLLQQRQTRELLAANATLETEIAERRQAEARARALISNLPGGAAFVVDRNLRYLLAEGEALAIAGFKPEDLVGKTIFEVLPAKLAKYYEPMYRKALAGEPFEHEHNAHERTYISRGTPLRAENGEIYAVLVVSYDITVRKQAENALQESEERFRLFVTASSDIIYRMSADWCEMYSLVGKNFLVSTENSSQTWIETYIPPEEQPRVWAAIQSAIDTKSMFELEHQVIQQDGAIGWTFSRAIPTLNEQGDIVEWFGSASDVTQRKRSEEALRESEERFRTLANTAPALIWYNDAQGENRFINQYFLDFTGKSAEQIRGEGWHTLVHPDDAELYIADYLAAVCEQRSWYNRNRIRRHDGVWRWHNNYAHPLFNADGVYLGHVGVTIDNTDAIEAEIALRESEAKYRSLFDSIDEGFCIFEMVYNEAGEAVDFRYIETNSGFERQSGRRPQPGQTMRELFPEAEDMWLKDYAEVARTGQPKRFIDFHEDIGRWFDVFVFPISNDRNQLAALFSDVTDEKRAEASLRESEERLQKAISIETVGVLFFTLDGRITDANDTFLAMSGYSRDELRTTTDWQDLTPPEFWNATSVAALELATQGKTAPYEKQYLRKDGSRWWGLFAPTRLKGSGRNAECVEFVIDISDRKRVEETLRESKARQAFLLQMSDALRSLFDPIEIQRAATRILGEHLVADRVFYTTMMPDNVTTIIHDNYVREGVPKLLGSVYVTDVGNAAVQLRNGETVVLTDVTTDEFTESEKAAYTRIDVVAAIAVPLVKGNRWVATLVAHSRTPRHWTAAEVVLVQETAERTWAAVERANAEATTAADLANTKLLRELAERLVSEENVGNIYDEILSTTIAIARADAGTIQIYDSQAKSLEMIASKNFSRTITDYFYHVNASSRTACGIAMNTGQSNFVDFPDEVADFGCQLLVDEGLQAALALPLVSRTGTPLGMLNAHWRETRHRPTDRELRFLDLLARQAADLIEQRQAEAALRESEEKLSALFASSPVPFMVLEPNPPDFTITAANEAYFAATLTTPEGLIGRRLFDVFTDDPNRPGQLGSEALAISLNRVLSTRQTDAMERTRYDLVVPGGFEPHWWDAVNAPLLNASGEVTAIIHQVNRVTELHFAGVAEQENQERQAFLLKLSEILQRFVQPNDIKTAVMRLLGEHLGVSRAQYHECDSSGEYYSADGVGYANGLPLLDLKYRIDAFGTFVNEDFAAGCPYRIDDLEVHPRVSAEERAAYRSYQIRAGAGVPLIRGGKLVAILAVHDVHPHPWTDLEMDLIRETAERIWTPIERARVQEALRGSEEKYRSLFDTIDEGFAIAEVIYDASGQPIDILYLEANPAASRLTGVPDFMQRRMSEISPDWEPDWVELYARVAQSGTSERTERYATPFKRWYDFSIFRLETAMESSDRRVAVIFQDITDRKRTEEQQAFLLKFSDALRAEPDADAVANRAIQMLIEQLQLDRSYITTYYLEDNRADLNYQIGNDSVPPLPDHFVLSDFSEALKATFEGTLVIEDDWERQGLSEAEKRNSHNLGMRAMVAATLRKENHPLWSMVALSSRPRRWISAEIALVEEVAERTWVAIERARAEAALRESELQRVREQADHEQQRQRAESLAELDRAKTLFLGNISHEFRTPLTLSLAPLQDALSDRSHPLDPVHRERLELVHRNSLRLLKLVNTLLDFSRIEAGRMEAVYEPTDLATYTAELSSVFSSALERAGLQLIVDCPPLPEPVFVDQEMWEKIVLNLLSNAFKFTFEGAITVKLRPADGNQAILQIQDTGTGIAPEHLPHLFERFYQVRGTQARTHDGSGIGLTLVHELVRLQGGTIEVSSTVGEGTCFTIALPFGTDHLPSDRLQDEGDLQPVRTLASTAMGATAYVEEARWLPEENGEASIPTPYSLLPTSPSARVLVVDDNADMREYLTRILSEHVQVEAVADGATALTVAQEQVPNLILSDVMMPGLDGFELLEALRADLRTREIPIILLSARAGEEAIVEGLEAGADDYLIKPFSAQELISRVTAHLQMAQLRGEALQQERIMNRQKDEFISVVSHELNTPLVSILGWTRILRSSPPNPVMLNKALETIERNATLQGKLVQDLLDMSCITAGKLRLNPQPIELQPVIESAIATVTQSAADKGIHLTWQENVTEPVVVMGDSDRLSQVLTNLLTNAIKFTPESGSVTVELSVMNNNGSADATYAEIRVIDTGIGITADFLPKVFDRFRQAEGVHSVKGLGLGLAIAHHIVELHNGTISAQSAGVGQGATFIVRLPLLKSHDQ